MPFPDACHVFVGDAPVVPLTDGVAEFSLSSEAGPVAGPAGPHIPGAGHDPARWQDAWEGLVEFGLAQG